MNVHNLLTLIIIYLIVCVCVFAIVNILEINKILSFTNSFFYSQVDLQTFMSGHQKMDFLFIFSLEFETYVVCCVIFLAELKNSLI